MKVLKYTAFPNRHYPNGRESIFFIPLESDSYAKNCGFYRSKPFTNSWHLTNNPDNKKQFKGMPLAAKYNCYTTYMVTEPTQEESKEYLKLLHDLAPEEFEMLVELYDNGLI